MSSPFHPSDHEVSLSPSTASAGAVEWVFFTLPGASLALCGGDAPACPPEDAALRAGPRRPLQRRQLLAQAQL